MNPQDKNRQEIEILLDSYFKDRKYYAFDELVSELSELIKRREREAVEGFVRSKHANVYGDIPSFQEIEYKAELLEAEQFLKESEGQDE